MAGGVIMVRRGGGWGCDHSEGGRVAGGVIVVRGEEGDWGCDRSEGGEGDWGCDRSEGERWLGV